MRDDYRTAGFPMLATIDDSGRASARIALVYAAAMTLCAVIVAVTATTGVLYATTALVTGGAYIAFSSQFVRRPETAAARRLFFSSLFVLPLLLSSLIAEFVLL